MRRISAALAVVSVLLAACLSHAYAQDAKPVAPEPAGVREYRIVVLADVAGIEQALEQGPVETAGAAEAKFNEPGRDGWEYRGDLPGPAAFKRPNP